MFLYQLRNNAAHVGLQHLFFHLDSPFMLWIGTFHYITRAHTTPGSHSVQSPASGTCTYDVRLCHIPLMVEPSWGRVLPIRFRGSVSM